MDQKNTKRTKKLEKAFRPRIKSIAYAVGIIVAELAAGSAYADSGVGVDTALGNALNPPGRWVPSVVGADVDVMGSVRHSPTGQLYGIPLLESEGEKSASGWEYSGGIEAGALGGEANEKNALFRQYKDIRNGPYLNYFEVEANKPKDALYFQSFGGGAGRHDQFYGIQYGRHNDWRVKLFYNETIHVFTDTWKSLYDGEGTGNLTISGVPAFPTQIKSGSFTQGTPNYHGATSTCTPTAPCWSYNGQIFSNATALAGINGIAGTPDPITGLIPTPPGTTPQSNMAKAIADKLATTPYSELSLVRKKGGMRADQMLSDNWKAYASYTLEKREGARPFGMNEGNISTEIAEPIDYDTHDLLAGLSYGDKLTQVNLSTSLSAFRNNISTLNVQYPLLAAATPNGAVQHATFDLPPDNDAANIRGEFGRNFPNFLNSRLTTTASWGTNRQNDPLLAPISDVQNADYAAAGVTTLNGNNIGYAANTGLISNWNTTNALSQQTAQQRIDNTLLDVAFNMKPVDSFRVKADTRYFATDNKGGYMAYNPLTGQFGRGFADGNNTNLDTVVGRQPGAPINTAGNCYIPPGYPAVPGCTFGLANVITTGANTPVFGQARSTKQMNYVLGADYDLTRTSSVNAAVEREDFHRDFREREKTWEYKYKLGFVDRALTESTSLRASYEQDRKRGSDYRYRTFEDLGTGLPGLDPATIIANANAGQTGYPALITPGLFNRYSFFFRKYDQADRDQKILNTRLIVAPREDMDLGLTVQWKDVKYPDSFYGLETDKQTSGTLDFNYQPSQETVLYAFYSYQQAKKAMNMNAGFNGVPNTACNLNDLNTFGYSACSDFDPNTGNGTRFATSAWSSETEDRNHVVGLGFQHALTSRVRFGLDYSYSYAKTEIAYNYGSTALNANATATTQAAADAVNAAAGYMLPSMTFTQHILNVNFVVQMSKHMSVRVFDRYEIGKVKDWHYDGVLSGVVANYDSGTLLLDAGPQDYHANVVGGLLQYRF